MFKISTNQYNAEIKTLLFIYKKLFFNETIASRMFRGGQTSSIVNMASLQCSIWILQGRRRGCEQPTEAQTKLKGFELQST